MFEEFNDESAHAFIETIKTNSELKSIIRSTAKLRRLRQLGEIVKKRVSDNFNESDFLDMLTNEEREREFYSSLK